MKSIGEIQDQSQHGRKLLGTIQPLTDQNKLKGSSDGVKSRPVLKQTQLKFRPSTCDDVETSQRKCAGRSSVENKTKQICPNTPLIDDRPQQMCPNSPLVDYKTPELCPNRSLGVDKPQHKCLSISLADSTAHQTCPNRSLTDAEVQTDSGSQSCAVCSSIVKREAVENSVEELAEQFRAALQTALEENEALHNAYEDLRREYARLSVRAKRAKHFSLILQAIIEDAEENSGNETSEN